MAIIRFYDPPASTGPGHVMERLQKEMNRLFSDFSGRSPSPFGVGVFPPVNVSEDADNLYMRAELPGIKPEDIDISVEGDTLMLRGERKLTGGGESVNYHRRERESGRFRRILSLPVRINAEAVNASFKNGVLRIVLPKAAEAKPKQIKVSGD